MKQNVEHLIPAPGSAELLSVSKDSKDKGKTPVSIEKKTASSSSSLRTNPDDPLALGKLVVWKDIYAEVPVQTRSRFLAFLQGTKPYDYRVVLDQVSGIAQPGDLTFIMGASGAGKTTLLNILTQRNMRGIRVYGEVLVNKHPIDAANMRKISAYVQQEDNFIGELTVRETIVFAAMLRMDPKLTSEEKVTRADNVIRSMGLTYCEHTPIGGRYEKSISRGEKKRLAFACEILTDPPILFCDEPTSGLDSYMAIQVVAVMKMLAMNGKTVISTIHQPSSQVYELADNVIVMANGHTAYHGPANQVVEFFAKAGFKMETSHINPADFFMKIMSAAENESAESHNARVQKITQFFNKSPYAEMVRAVLHDNPSSNTERRRLREDYSALRQYKTSWLTQTQLLFIRAIRCVLRNPMILQVRLFQVVICAVAIGAVFLQMRLTHVTIQNYVGLMYNAVRDMNFMFVFPCINVFTSELLVVIREYKSSMYYPTAYFVGKNMADSIQYVVFPVIYSIIIYFMSFNLADMQAWSLISGAPVIKFLRYTLTNVLMATCATSIGYAAACICGSLELAAQTLPLIVVPLLIMGGLFINLRSVPAYFAWMEYISYYRFALEAHMNNFFYDVPSIPGCNVTAHDAYCHQILPEAIRDDAPKGEGPILMHFLKMRVGFFWFDMLFLVVATFALRLIAVVALHIRVSLR